MPATLINPNWYDQNSERVYPLMDGVTRLDTAGAYELPNNLIVDLRISAALSYDPTKFYIRRLQAFGSGVLVTVAVDGTGDVATAVVPSAGFEEFQPYRIVGLPGHLSITGVIVFSYAAALMAAGLADFTFDLAATRILPTLITPAQTGVTSLTIRDSFGGEVALVGAAVIAAGNNAALTVLGQTITVGMDSGVIIGDPCGAADPGGQSRPAIRSINGVVPDGTGAITITPIGCPEITAGNGGLVLTDRCAEPCCGDVEMAAIAENVQALDRFLADLANKAAQLESSTRSVESWLVQ